MDIASHSGSPAGRASSSAPMRRARSVPMAQIARGCGSIYPDMPWEPKQAFSAVASFYATH